VTRTIALLLPSTSAGATALRRLWERGDAVLPLDPGASRHELDAVVSAARPDRVATVDDLDGRAVPAPWPTADGTALVVTTSGSTGARKAVVLSTAAVTASTAASLARLDARAGEVWRVPLPLHHIAGVMALRRGWHLGTDPQVVAPGDRDALVAPGADHVAVVPTQLHRWLERDPGGGPRSVLLGGAAADPALLARARDAGLVVTTSYGMSETCGGCVYDGRPLDGVEVDLAADTVGGDLGGDPDPDVDGDPAVGTERGVRTGRIRLRGSVRFDGYRGDPAATAAVTDADGWFTTGDRGRFDDAGRLVVLGRADDVAVSGGENVPLAPVAAALRGLEGVADAAVVAVPDAEWGEVVRAVVVPSDPSDPPGLDGVRAHVRVGLPSTHAPRELAVVPALPRDGMGKVTRAALRALPVTERR
jgi:o-succinylbenzoate---CoA ligase